VVAAEVLGRSMAGTPCVGGWVVGSQFSVAEAAPLEIGDPGGVVRVMEGRHADGATSCVRVILAYSRMEVK
jgi:hypothetical protein